MKCPFCEELDNRVIDSRLSQDGQAIRRRRQCDHCQRRFTTYERAERSFPLVVKKDGRREAFDREKLKTGIIKACEKRPISIDVIEQFVDDFEKMIQEQGERELPTEVVGQRVMDYLRGLDDVAYVRFASVYRSFKDLKEFMEQLQQLIQHPRLSSKKKK